MRLLNRQLFSTSVFLAAGQNPSRLRRLLFEKMQDRRLLATIDITPAGTAARDTLIGTTAANVMFGGRGNDTPIGSEADVLTVGQGNDVQAIRDLTFKRLVGRTGTQGPMTPSNYITNLVRRRDAWPKIDDLRQD